MLNTAQVYGVSGGVSAFAAVIAVLVILRFSKFSRNIKIASSVGVVAACTLVFGVSSYGVLKSRSVSGLIDADDTETADDAEIADDADDTDEEQKTCTAGKKQCDEWGGKIYCNEKCEAYMEKGGSRLSSCDSVCS